MAGLLCPHVYQKKLGQIQTRTSFNHVRNWFYCMVAINYSNFVPPRVPYRTICIILSNIMNIGFISYAFSFPEATAPCLTLSFLDTLPGGSILKKISLLLIAIGIFYLWHTNFYHTSNTNYGIALVMLILMYVLLYRSAHRNLPK